MKFKIIACSSEDPVHPVSNLLNADLYRTWQTNGSTKQATVDLEFPEPTEINIVDIGNAGSAFVEVLVGKSDGKYEVLVPIQSMMSLQDAKSNSNRSRTKCVLKEKFTSEVAQKKWERMRLVCTQPFSTNVFGLSYVSVNTSPSLQSPSQTTKNNNINNNKNNNNNNNNNNSDEVDTDVDEDAPVAPKVAVQRENSALLKKLQNEMKQKGKQTDDIENLLDKNSNNKSKHKIQADSDQEEEENPPPLKKVPSSLVLKPKNNKDTTPKTNAKNSKDQKGEDKPLNTILKGVVFAISGIMHPERGEIREKATALGAVYKRDWDDECTHLICSFANTPKYFEVKGKGGIITTPQWVMDCHKNGRKLKLTKEDKPKLSADSTAEKKKKKKKKNPSSDPNKGYDSDSNDDDDGKPDEYDYNDSFIDNSSSRDLEQDSDEDGDFVPRNDFDEPSDASDDDDVNEVVREGKAFLKSLGGLKKRPRYEGYSDDEEHDSGHKKPKQQNNKPSHHEGKTFSKQNNSNAEKKPQVSKTTNSDSDNEPKHKKPTKPVEKPTKHVEKPTKSAEKPKKQHDDDSGSGTDPMADDDIKKTFKAMEFPDETPSTKEKAKEKEKEKNNKQPANKKGKYDLPNDDSGSGTEGMSDVDIRKNDVDHSDASDSEGTEPIDKDVLKSVLGALGGGGGRGSDATQAVDADTNWEELVTKKFDEKAKEEEKLGKPYPVDMLPSFLSSVQAFFSGVASKNEFNLRKYIIAYNGTIDEYLGDSTKYIFTERTWDRDFDDALSMNPNLVFVKPAWVFACHSSQKMVDYGPFRIVKKKA